MEMQAFFEKVETIKMPIRIAILVCSIVILVGIFIPLIYFPKSNEIKASNTVIEDLNKQLLDAKRQRQRLPEAQKEREAAEAQLKEASKLLPISKEIPSLLTKISELASNSELDIRMITQKPEVPKDFYMEIPIAIEVSGNYHNVAMFFEKVGKMERIMNIQNVSMKPISDRSTTLITTCDATTYRFKGN